MALARAHRRLPVGGRLDLSLLRRSLPDQSADDGNDGEGRDVTPVADMRPDALVHLLVGAGFTVDEVGAGCSSDAEPARSRRSGSTGFAPGEPPLPEQIAATHSPRHRPSGSAGFAGCEPPLPEQIATSPAPLLSRARRARTLPDTVGPGMRLLVCGLNPSLYAADAGVGFARPGNRFWPAALAAGIVSVDRDPDHALHHHDVGMTDLVKRATVAAGELAPEEYRAGLRRVERLVAWLRPRAICVVGLAGWRTAVERRATAGVQRRPLAGVPVYLMPSTSGLNARTPPAEHAEHLRRAARLADAPV